MFKIFHKTLIFFSILLIIIITYLAFFGISTSKFNNNIQDKINGNYPNVKVEFKDIKILLDLLNLSVSIETKDPVIFFEDKDIKVNKIYTKVDIKSYIKREFAIKNLYFDFKKNNIKNIISLIRANKDNPQLLILDKLIKDGNITNLSGQVFFNEKGKIIKDSLKIISAFDNLSLKLFDKTEVKNISANLAYKNNNIELTNLNLSYLGINLLSDSISIKILNGIFNVKGDLKSSKNKIPKEILSKIFKENNLENVTLSSKNNFNFNISKRFKISDFKIISNINLDEADIVMLSQNIEKYLPEYNKILKLKNHSVVINFKKKISIDGSGYIQVGKKRDKIDYNLDINNKNFNYLLKVDLNQIPLNLDLINFSKKTGVKAKIEINGKKNNNKSKISKISFISENDNFVIDNIDISKNYRILNFDKIKLTYIDNQNQKNDLLIKKNKKNIYYISGDNFNLDKVIDNILFNENEDSLRLFDKTSKSFKLNIKKNNIDKNHYVLNLKGNFQIKDNKIIDMTLKSHFPDGKKVTMTTRSKNKKKIITFYSGFAKPFVKKYRFIRGFEEGKLDFYSVKENNISNSKLKIYDFKLQELPALTKLLTLASLQGIADILTGEGVRFDEFEMNFKNEKKLMEIVEIYAIGPAISILLDGYIQANKLISLRGTLVPATTINKFVGSIPILGNILVGKKTGEGVFGVSFKIKGPPKNLKTTVNPVKTLTPRFITRTLEKIKKTN